MARAHSCDKGEKTLKSEMNKAGKSSDAQHF